MPATTTRIALNKGLGGDNARDYLKTSLAASLDVLDLQGGHTGWKGADTASAATLNLPADTNYIHVTGATGITAIGPRNAGELIVLEFDSTPTLTHNAGSLILQGATNLVAQAGDVVTFVSEGGGNWREVCRRRPSAIALAGSDTTERTTSSTSAVDLSSVVVNLPAAQPFLVVASFWLTPNVGGAGVIGLKLNTTEVLVSGPAGLLSNNNDSGIMTCQVGAHDANELRTGYAVRGSNFTAFTGTMFTADIPNAPITAVVIRGLVAGAASTLHVKNVYVYALPTS
jgi:hypothetical protein